MVVIGDDVLDCIAIATREEVISDVDIKMLTASKTGIVAVVSAPICRWEVPAHEIVDKLWGDKN